jgi:NAD(P)-dependent dehydrogenase (short-subunit alcohol dehydrogenase family)
MGRAGARVIAHYSSDKLGAEKAVANIPAGRSAVIQQDLLSQGAGHELWDAALKEFDTIDCVVLNAAVNIETPFESSRSDWSRGWEETLAVNVRENANLVHASLPRFLDQKFGIYIAMSSWSAQKGSAISSLSAYAASKAAIKAMMQTVAINYGKDGVMSFILAPGVVNTRMADLGRKMRGGDQALNDAMALGRIVEPEEIGELAAVLATGVFPNLTGSTIDVNGASYIR